jgi:hypothetical protein
MKLFIVILASRPGFGRVQVDSQYTTECRYMLYTYKPLEYIHITHALSPKG